MNNFGIVVMEHARPECLRLTLWSLEQCPELAGVPHWVSVCQPLAQTWPDNVGTWDVVRWSTALSPIAHHMAATSFALRRCERVLVLDGDVLVRPTALAVAMAFPDDVPFCSLWRQGTGLEQVNDYSTMSNVVSGRFYGQLLMFLLAKDYIGMPFRWLDEEHVIRDDETGHDTLYAAWMHSTGLMSRHAERTQCCHFGFKGTNNRRNDLYDEVFSKQTFEEQANAVIRIYKRYTAPLFRAMNGMAPMEFEP